MIERTIALAVCLWRLCQVVQRNVVAHSLYESESMHCLVQIVRVDTRESQAEKRGKMTSEPLGACDDLGQHLQRSDG